MPSGIIEIEKDKKTKFKGHVTAPAHGVYPGILLLHQEYGVDANIRATAELFAAHNYTVFVPDIFWQKELNTGRITFEQVMDYHRSYRNVISEFIIPIKVIKSEESDIKFKELNLKEFNEL